MQLFVRKRALALGLLISACTPGEPRTTDDPSTTAATTSETTTGESSTTHPTTTPLDPTTDASTTADPTTATTADPTTTCADLCQRILDCRIPTTVEQCTADCEATAPALQACTLACIDARTCDDLLHCTTLCNHEGDPDATPYADCVDDAAHCLPDVYVCINTAHGDEQFSVCAPFCDDQGQCPIPTTGTAPPVCDLDTVPHTCSLDCSDGQQCPDDMTCDIESGICAWPVL